MCMTFFWMVILFAIVRPTYQVLYSCNSTAVCGCSKNSASLTKIVGGETAGTATWGWAVSLSIGGTSICGGSVLSKSWVITAAHCVDGVSAQEIDVYAGSNIIWSGTQHRTVSQVIVHPNYNSSTYVNDIALLQLTPTLNMSDSAVSSICLPSVNSTILAAGEWPVVNTTVIAVGWGRLSEGGSLPNNLQQVTLETFNYQASTCTDVISDWHVQLCAGVPGGTKDTCQGDSGGPLMMFTSSNQWLLVGLTSNGIGCARESYSGAYTRVAAFEGWLKSYATDAHWIVMNSHANTISTSASNLIFFVALVFFVTFRH